MRFNSTLWKANLIAFISSFCVMVIELIAARMLAPDIGVSLYTWTSIIGVILAGIALGNYLGGKIADRFTSPLVLVLIFFAGALATIAILPATKLFAEATWFSNWPLMLDLTIKISSIFFIPAIILSMVSPVVIKLTLADLGQTGGVVGTIYAFSTVGAILGTFMTGFYFILWFGTRLMVWLVAVILILAGILTLFSWKVPNRWKLSLRNFVLWIAIMGVVLTSVIFFQSRERWQENFTKESNYYTIRVLNEGDVKVLVLDRLVHSYVIPERPLVLKYPYLQILEEIVKYIARENPALKVLHLGGGGYSFPRYLEIVYPQSVNEVVEIDPAVTQVAYEELGLPLNTSIRTYNVDARFFLLQRKAEEKYDIVIGDVFNDTATPYHLTTLEFDKLLKTHMSSGGVYLLNIIDDYAKGRYLPSLLYTLKQTFKYVYLFTTLESFDDAGRGTYIVAATDYRIDLADYMKFTSEGGKKKTIGTPHDEMKLEKYLAEKNPILLTDDHAPTDILVVPLYQ